MSVNAPLIGLGARSQGGVQWDTAEIRTEMVCPFTEKRLFRKAIDCGLLANAGADTTAHGIADLNVAEGAFMEIKGVVSDGTTVEPLNQCTGVSLVEVNATNVVVTSTVDLTSHRCLVVLEYTKTT